jgi:uncharacterized protein (TIGR02145 family)
MKQTKLFLFIFMLLTTINTLAQVGIGTTTPAVSAELDVSSTTKGLLPPRMTIGQRNAVVSPTEGLMVWCIDCNELQVYNGTIWKKMNGFAACVLPTLPNVTICNQTWMIKNLDVSTYRNGDPIPKVTDATEWAALTTGAYCYINNDSAAYAATYGKQYNWFAVNDPRGLAPLGWHVPSDMEWTTLETCIGFGVGAGGKTKEAGTTHWQAPNEGATNSSGFTGLPGGYRPHTGSSGGGIPGGLGIWWSSNESSVIRAVFRYTTSTSSTLFRNSDDKRWGVSVRCLMD